MSTKKVALISDLHSNIEALEAVLKDISSQGVDNVFCLGDLIGYGPNPREMIRHAFNWSFSLRGNHEDALLFLALDFNPEAAQAIDWTRNQLNDVSAAKEENHKMWNYLGDLPDIKEDDGVTYLHASPRNRTKEYVRPHDVQDKEKMEEIFSMIKHACFCGHTHEPGVFTEDFKFYPPRAFANKVKLSDGRKYYVNIGSVGQPRDRDTRSCYVIWDPETQVVEFRRVEYDYRKTMDKIYAIKQIPRRFGERLEVGR
jgi:diadenosine tetraphosphatase ApaH/serine/threonine PP2A family protein phosphatase